MESSKYRWLLAGTLALGLAGIGAAVIRADDKPDKEDKNEVKVTVDQLPAAVKATLTKEAGDGKIGDIDKETEDGKVQYEADVTVGDKEYEIKIAEDGTLLSKKVEKPEDEKKEKDEKAAK